MNRRVCVWIGSILGCGLAWGTAGGLTASTAFGQVAPASPPAPVPVATVPATIVAAQGQANALPSTGVIRAFIATELTALGSANPVTAQSARMTLEAACPRAAAVTTSFRGVYAQQLSAAAVPLLVPATSLPTRVKLGVVITDVGNSIMSVGNDAQGLNLLPAVQKLLADPNDAAALWGMKAARPMVVCLVVQPGGPGTTTLFKNVVNAVAKHTTGNLAGFIATDAYRALVVNPTQVPGLQQVAVRPLLKPLFDPVMDLLELRTKQYATGLIPAPDAERDVPLFLSRDFTPPAGQPPLMTNPQKTRAVQDLVNLIDEAGQRSPLATVPQLAQLRETLTLAGSALNVMSAGTAMRGLATLPLAATAPVMMAQTSTAFPNMTTPFPGLVKPPVLPAIAPPAPPAPATPGAPAAPQP